MGGGKAVVLPHKIGDGGKGELLEVLRGGVGAHGVVVAVEQFVVAVAGKIVGPLEIGFELGGAPTDISVEELRGDRRSLEHAGNEGQQLVGEFAHKIERDIAGTYIGGAFPKSWGLFRTTYME